MSLMVYDRWELYDGKIPVPYIYNTSEYFDNNLLLPDTLLVRDILKTIDGAGYISETKVQGWLEPVGVIDKSDISSGCKAVLCTALATDKCFSHACCGPNAVYKMLQLNEGNMVYVGSQYPYTYGLPCDIIYHGKRFFDILSFLKWRGNNGLDK